MVEPLTPRADLPQLPPGLRPMQLSDIPLVHAIEKLSFYSPWRPSYFHRCLNQGCQGWVLETEGEVRAYLIAAHGEGVTHLMNLCVAPPWRRKGLGRNLLRYLIALARQRGARTIILEVRASNRLARDLYQSEGFVELGVRRDYYPAPDGREDARILCLHL